MCGACVCLVCVWSAGVVSVVVGVAGRGPCGEGVGSVRGTAGTQLLLDHTGTKRKGGLRLL